jgi:translation elongation factor aEF-1 beta
MGVAALKIKIMPESAETDLSSLAEDIKKKLEKAGAIKINNTEEEPIAFGLKAVIITLAWPEEKETDLALNAARKNKEVKSAEVLDYRRSFG